MGVLAVQLDHVTLAMMTRAKDKKNHQLGENVFSNLFRVISIVRL